MAGSDAEIQRHRCVECDEILSFLVDCLQLFEKMVLGTFLDNPDWEV